MVVFFFFFFFPMQQAGCNLQDVVLLRIVATVLDPSFHYKTLACSASTTSYDAVCVLVKKYSIRMEDQSPQNFYLMEVSEFEYS